MLYRYTHGAILVTDVGETEDRSVDWEQGASAPSRVAR